MVKTKKVNEFHRHHEHEGISEADISGLFLKADASPHVAHHSVSED